MTLASKSTINDYSQNRWSRGMTFCTEVYHPYNPSGLQGFQAFQTYLEVLKVCQNIQKGAHSWALISSCSWPTLSHLRITKSTTADKSLFLPPAWSNILRKLLVIECGRRWIWTVYSFHFWGVGVSFGGKMENIFADKRSFWSDASLM